MTSKVLMGFVGDVLVNRDNPKEIFSKVADVLHVPDVMFGNLEGAHTDDQHRIGYCTVSASNLDVYAQAGFNVLSMANNHVADAGYGDMLKTRARLRSQGIKTSGAGETLDDAREPAILKVNGITVAVLAYASHFPVGFEARANAPGLVPMRAYNVLREAYPSLPAYYSGGMPPYLTTVPDQTDLALLTDDIKRARDRADLVVMSFHWGDMTRPFHLTDHETRTARHCIDHGAHMVVGHHHHALRGMEWYKGRPIMYGLGHFTFEVRWEWSEEEEKRFFESDVGRYFKQVGYEGRPRKGWPLHGYPDDYRMNVVAWATGDRDSITDIGFLPCRITSDALVYPLAIESPEGKEVALYLERCNISQGLNGKIVSEGGISLAGFQTLRVVPQ